MSLRPATPADDVAGVIRAAFGDEGDQVAAIWADLEREGLVLGSIVAEVDGAVVGHVGLSPAWLDARRELVDVWLLSPLSVLPDHQIGGLGTRLVGAAIEAAVAGGAPMLFVEGSPAYYRSRGFEPARRLGLLQPTDRVPGPAFQVARLDGYQSWMTGRLVYRDVWWRHDAAGLRDPLLAELEEEYE
ncbi:MAG TPA: N-acetyltransferase [Marmoricola sp.]|nr:N-acetyltransferase [Marmoricola sp.]